MPGEKEVAWFEILQRSGTQIDGTIIPVCESIEFGIVVSCLVPESSRHKFEKILPQVAKGLQISTSNGLLAVEDSAFWYGNKLECLIRKDGTTESVTGINPTLAK